VSDRPDDPSDDETPEIAEVRRLLADARHVDPMPEDVAARMSGVLDRLGDETPAARPESAATNVIAIAPHRRRRAAALLVAAAAIVAGGVVIQNLRLSSEGTSAATEAPAGAQQQSDNAMEDGSTAPTTPYSSERAEPPTPVKIHPRRFAFDALQARQKLTQESYDLAVRHSAKAADCTNVPSDARALPATYRRSDAALVFERPRGGSQVVELFVCGSTEPIRSTTLPVP
jgi:hypothetical protein